MKDNLVVNSILYRRIEMNMLRKLNYSNSPVDIEDDLIKGPLWNLKDFMENYITGED